MAPQPVGIARNRSENGASVPHPFAPRRRRRLPLADDVAQRDELRLQRLEIGLRHAAEGRGDPAVLDGERPLRHPAAGLGEVDSVLATVDGGRAALDQARFGQAVDQARDVALGDIEPLGQFLLADALLLGQRGQDVALRD